MSKHIVKLLVFIGLKKAMIEYAFNSQSKSYKEHLEFAFFDSKRQRYYRYPDLKKIPVKRLELIIKMQEVIKEGLRRGKGDYLAEWITVAENTLEKSKTPKVELSKMLYALKERSKLFDEALLIELACLTFIREDENPGQFSEELHKEKFEQIKTDLQSRAGGLYFFFQQAGLSDYLPSEIGSAIDYEAFTKSQTMKMEKYLQELRKTSSLLEGLKE